jgi:hypothetical protein
MSRNLIVYLSRRGDRQPCLSWSNPSFDSKHYSNASRLIDAIFSVKASKKQEDVEVRITERMSIKRTANKVLSITLKRRN